MGYEYHLDSALVKPTQERWLKLQDLILRLKSKHVLTTRCLMSRIGLLTSTEKMVPDGRLHMRPFQFHLKEHRRYPQSLDSLLSLTETFSAHLESRKCDERFRPSSQDRSIQLFTNASNEGWGTHLGLASFRVCGQKGKKATHKCSRVEGSFSGPLKSQGPVSNQRVLAATDNSTVMVYINKQGGTHSAEMCTLLWRIMTWCHHFQITRKPDIFQGVGM